MRTRFRPRESGDNAITAIVIALAVVLMATTARSVRRAHDPALARLAAATSPLAGRAAFHDFLLHPERSTSHGRGSRS